MRTLLSVSLGVVALGALPAAALAQAWTPGSEIVGQSVQVTTNGVTNTVYLDPGGSRADHHPGRQHRPRDVDRGQRAAVPQQRHGAGMLALYRRRSRPASR